MGSVNAVIAVKLIEGLAHVVLGDGSTLERVASRVEHWAAFAISSTEKRHNVLADLETIGIRLTESTARLAIELALKYLRLKGLIDAPQEAK